jgi:hypothetical protein
MQLIRPILAGEVRSFAVREEASAKYNAWMQKRLTGIVWNFCNSYYRRESGTGKNIAAFPGPVSLFWWLARRARYSDYEVVGGERWLRMRRLKGIVRATLQVVVIAVVVGRLQGEWLHHLVEREIQLLCFI